MSSYTRTIGSEVNTNYRQWSGTKISRVSRENILWNVTMIVNWFILLLITVRTCFGERGCIGHLLMRFIIGTRRGHGIISIPLSVSLHQRCVSILRRLCGGIRRMLDAPCSIARTMIPACSLRASIIHRVILWTRILSLIQLSNQLIHLAKMDHLHSILWYIQLQDAKLRYMILI